MSKNCFPGYTLEKVPEITIGGVVTPPTSCDNTSSSVTINTDLLEEYLKNCKLPESCDIVIPQDAKLIPLEDCEVYSVPSTCKETKPKVKKEKKKDRIRREKEELISAMRNNRSSSDDGLPLRSILECPAEVSERKRKLGEHELYRILTNKYTFGCYGSELYVRNTNGVYVPVTTSSIEKLLMKTLTEEQKERFAICTAKAVHSRLCASSEIEDHQLVFPVDKILFSNGCFDIINEEPALIEEHDFFITRINARYIPGKKLHAPYFESYLHACSQGDISIQRRICAMLGYLMLPGYPGKKIIVLGTARNSGKSVIARVFQRLVGPELVSGQTPFEMSESHASAEFRGKLANMMLDIPATIFRPPSVGTMKAVSGGDLISTNPKGKDRRTMLCFAKQVLGTNSGLKLQQFDEAFWERVEVIPYIYTIAPKDRIYDLEDKLMEERDAIVTMCIQEARLLVLNAFRFPECDVAEHMKKEWIGWHAYAKDFLLTHCVSEKGGYTPSTPLYNAYKQHCEEHGFPYGEPAGFIRYAKELFPSSGNAHRMINGVQQRGLPDVRFLGEL